MSLFPKDSFDYSSKVNPNLQSFINNNTTSSSSQKDLISQSSLKINVSNFKKSGPVYSMHRYWTKQPIEVISQFISSFCPSNGIVLDSFCGTGTTGTAALFTGRKAVLSDLSPIATFITRNYTEKTDLVAVEKAFKQLSTTLNPLLDHYYITICPDCHANASIKDWIYTENYLCPTCNSVLPFIQNTADWTSITSQKHSKLVHCDRCKASFTRNTLQTVEPSPLGLRYNCNKCKVRKKFKVLDSQDKNTLTDKLFLKNQQTFLRIPLPKGVSTNQAINKNIEYVNQFYTPLTFFILTNLWNTINTFPEATKLKLQFIFSSIIFRVTKLYRLRVKGQGGILSGTLYIPPVFQDINVWDVFAERFRKISKGWEELNKNLPANVNQSRIISTHSATNIPLPDSSIDYVYIDPPYGGNINYSELNFLWECWFNHFTDNTYEVIINEVGQQKALTEYERLFSLSLNELYRVLKPNRWCSIVFNSSSSRIWSSIQKIVYNSTFLMAKDIISLGSKMTTAKQTQSLKTARRYFVLNLYKPSEKLLAIDLQFVKKNISISKGIKSYIISEISKFISSTDHHSARYDEIYDHVISTLLPNYSFEEFDLDSILESNFTHSGDNHWTLIEPTEDNEV